MTLPLQTWIYPTLPQGVTNPQSTTTVMAAIKTALDAWTAGHWEVDHYTAGSRMTIRRKGSPGGVLGTFRAIVFGSTTDAPVQTALVGNNVSVQTPAADYLYCGVNEYAGTDVPLDPTTDPPWSTTTSSFTGGTLMGTFGAGTWNGEANISLFSTDRMLGIMLWNSLGTWSWTVFGEIVERASTATGLWGMVCSSQLTAAADMSLIAGSPIPSNDSWVCYGAFHDGSPKRLVRSNGVLGYSTNAPLSSVDGAGILIPIIMATGQMGDPSNRQMIGVLRQMRMGPYESGRKVVRNGEGTMLAISVNGAPTTSSSGMYLDQRA